MMKALEYICKPCDDSRKEIARLREEIQKLTKKINNSELSQEQKSCNCETPNFINNKSMIGGVICIGCGGGRA